MDPAAVQVTGSGGEESGVAGMGIDCCGPAAKPTDALAVPRRDGLSGGEGGGGRGRRRPGSPSRRHRSWPRRSLNGFLCCHWEACKHPCWWVGGERLLMVAAVTQVDVQQTQAQAVDDV